MPDTTIGRKTSNAAQIAQNKAGLGASDSDVENAQKAAEARQNKLALRTLESDMRRAEVEANAQISKNIMEGTGSVAKKGNAGTSAFSFA